jgi:hypothetical protein
VSVAAALEMDGETITEARLALGDLPITLDTLL